MVLRNYRVIELFICEMRTRNMAHLANDIVKYGRLRFGSEGILRHGI